MRSFLKPLAALFGGILLSACSADARQVDVHDPVMAQQGDTWYLFSTGPGITIYSSPDLVNWTPDGRAFATEPEWAKTVAPGFNGHLWAPDIIHHKGLYYLYYSVSAFGKNTSAIGVTVNKTLDSSSPDYGWEDKGIVVRSVPGRDLWNAIDPAVIIDDEGTPWMSFGSFWSGLKIFKLAPDMISIAQPEEWYSIAKRERSVLVSDTSGAPGALEAPFIFKKGDYYYLFVSWDKCCRGKDSDYKLVVGRSKTVTGPYFDKEGVDLNHGGGSLLIEGNERWPGVGHNSAYTFNGKDYLVVHAYEAADNYLQKFKMLEMQWDEDGWPVVDATELDSFVSKRVE